MLAVTRGLSVGPDICSEARRWIRTWLSSVASDCRRAGPFVDDVVLCLSELIADTPALTGQTLTAGVGLADDRAVVSVLTPTGAQLAEADELSRTSGIERARRHDLIAALASRRGVADDDAGREAWAEVRRPTDETNTTSTRLGVDTAPGQETSLTVAFDGPPGTLATLILTGELDISAVPTLRSALAEVVTDRRADLPVDLSGLTFCDSAGISELVESRFHFKRARRELSFVNASPSLQRTFRFARAASLLPTP